MLHGFFDAFLIVASLSFLWMWNQALKGWAKASQGWRRALDQHEEAVASHQREFRRLIAFLTDGKSEGHPGAGTVTLHSFLETLQAQGLIPAELEAEAGVKAGAEPVAEVEAEAPSGAEASTNIKPAPPTWRARWILPLLRAWAWLESLLRWMIG